MNRKEITTDLLLIALLSAILFIPFLGKVHLFDWDEINFAESAREMIVTGDYFRVHINYEPFWEKPPLFFWLQVLSMKAFGVNEFAARFPNAVCGIVTLSVLYLIGRRLWSRRMALLWVLMYAGSLLPHLYFKSGIIDPVFNLFIFLGIYFVSEGTGRGDGERRLSQFLLAGLFCGLGVLTKGPVALLITLLCIGAYWILSRFRMKATFKEMLVFAGMVLLVSFAWYGVETLQNGPWFLRRFITYQLELLSQPVAGHGQPFYYHFVVLLLGCFPASLFAVGAFAASHYGNVRQQSFLRWMKILFWVVLILFSVVKTKIVHYSSLCYLPLTFLAAYAADSAIQGIQPLAKLQRVLLAVIGIILGTAFTLFPIVGLYKDALIPYIRDPFAVANLEVEVSWTGFEFLIGLTFLGLLILSLVWLKKRVQKAVVLMCISMALFLQAFTAVVVPRIEKFSQSTAVCFFEGISGEDCYVQTLGYKSYAHYFYAAVRPHSNPKSSDTEWLLHGAIDKPVYFVCKITSANEIRKNYPHLRELKSEGGFVFFRRNP